MKQIIDGHFFELPNAVNPQEKTHLKIFNGITAPQSTEHSIANGEGPVDLDGVLESDLLEAVAETLLNKSLRYSIPALKDIALNIKITNKQLQVQFALQLKKGNQAK